MKVNALMLLVKQNGETIHVQEERTEFISMEQPIFCSLQKLSGLLLSVYHSYATIAAGSLKRLMVQVLICVLND